MQYLLRGPRCSSLHTVHCPYSEDLMPNREWINVLVFRSQASSMAGASTMSQASARAYTPAALDESERIKTLETGLEKASILYLEKQRQLCYHQPLSIRSPNVGSSALLREMVCFCSMLILSLMYECIIEVSTFGPTRPAINILQNLYYGL